MEANTFNNALIRWQTFNQLGVVVSSQHMAMKFPSKDKVIIKIKVDLKEACECYAQILKVTVYYLKVPLIHRLTQTEVLELPNGTKDEENNVKQQCHNIELEQHLLDSVKERVNLDP